MKHDTTGSDPDHVEEAPRSFSPVFHAELRDLSGQVRAVGRIVPMIVGDERPLAIRVDGQIFVSTGDIVGSGSTPVRHVYAQAAPAAFIANGD